MTKLIFFTLCFTIITVSKCEKLKPETKIVITTEVTTLSDDSTKAMDLMAVMMECNDTFIVEMSFLEALNTTGSFPDETDRTPKCYLRCVLENIEVVSTEGKFDPQRAAMIFAVTRKGIQMDKTVEMIRICADRKETCKCDRSYQFLKCLFSMEIEYSNGHSN